LRKLVVEPMRVMVEGSIIQEIPQFLRYVGQDSSVSQDGLGTAIIRAFFRLLFTRLFLQLPDAGTKSLVGIIGVAVDKHQRAQFTRQLRQSIGVNVIGSEKKVKPTLERFAKENSKLIKSIKTDYIKQVEQVVTQAVVSGERAETLEKKIRERGKVSDKRAKLIARDQVGKLTGQLDKVRQQGLGLTGYIWQTVNDNRVRELHEDRQGKHFNWDDPPSKTPDDGPPGEPINCRCYAEPDVESLLQQAESVIEDED
jgi:SPP1 gp7 family putative phage head morphogenesis protein